jgi:peptidase M15-like protein
MHRGAALLLATACAEAGERPGPGWQTGPVSSGDHGDGADTLDVDPIDTTEESGPVAEADEEGGDEGFDCAGEDAQACMCPDGPGMGIQYCEGGMWGHCTCEGESTGAVDGGSTGDATSTTSGDGGTTGEPEPMPTEVCYPGSDGSFTTCFPLHYFAPEAPPVGYEYPDALGGDPNYRRPIAFIDLSECDAATALSPNFQLGELAQLVKGQYAIVQPSAVQALQDLRDAAGPLNVNSGYRSPAYNADIGGAGYSRHMYGDGYDLDPVSITIDALEGLCTDQGGFLVQYETHVHCDWRDVDVAIEFFGQPDAAAPPSSPPLFAELHNAGAVWWADHEGFDEGEPLRRWIARDEDGNVLSRVTARSFVAPAGTASIELDVGRVITLQAAMIAVPEVGLEPT